MGVGMIAHGPELRAMAVDGAIDRLADFFTDRSVTGDAWNLEIVFDVPGSLGASDFVGVRTGRVSPSQRRAQVLVAVPNEVARSDEPDIALIDLAAEAVEVGLIEVQKRGGYLDKHGLHQALENARAAVERDGPAGPTPMTPAELDQDALLADAMAELGQSKSSHRLDDDQGSLRQADPGDVGARIDIELTIGDDRSALEDAFELEARIASELESTQRGMIDGNEIGQGKFTIFAEGAAMSPLVDMATRLIRDSWTQPGVVIRQFGGSDEEQELRVQ